MQHQIRDIPRRGRPSEERNLTQGRESKTRPAGGPKTEVSSVMISAEQGKEHQQDDEGAGFEEGNPEQALVLQHDAPPPGRTCRSTVLELPHSW
ncbi:MAG TPA: hypothetical protein VFI60_06960 [Candidatus Acidoferrum sp.]|nr:hypothetical protein [Candidatus Acidoferrum sp.]